MSEKTTRQFGLWQSPITPGSLAEGRRLEAARWDSDGRTLVWLEGRSGRGVLVAQRTVIMGGSAGGFTVLQTMVSHPEAFKASDVYRRRSPVFYADRIRRPLAIFQGDIDQVVPREQSDLIVKALQDNGTPHVYHVYEGEGHGWRQRDTIEHFYRTVDAFLRKHVLFS